MSTRRGCPRTEAAGGGYMHNNGLVINQRHKEVVVLKSRKSLSAREAEWGARERTTVCARVCVCVCVLFDRERERERE